MYALERAFPSHPVKVFDASGPFRTHIEQFAAAAVVIAPHGAGLANLVFCAPGTTVIELGYDSSKHMTFDNSM
jgi:capsular polysaccharide biosynthesis protein